MSRHHKENPSPGQLQIRQDSLRSIPWTWKDLFLGLVPLVAIRVVMPLLPTANLPTVVRWLLLPVTFLGMAWMLGFPIWVARRRHAQMPKLSIRAVVIEALLAIPFFIVLWVALVVVVAAWIYLVGGEPPNNPLEPTVQAGNWVVAVVFTLVAAIAAPITEEVFFRGMVYNCLCQRMHFILAIILQGAVFGWLHTFGYVHAAMASLLGMALAALYEWRRTLLTPIFVHAFQNALVGSIAVMGAINTANAPVLGIQGDPNDDGCLVTKVFPETAADEAGLQADDVITSIDGEPVVKIQDVSNAVRKKRVGDLVELTFLRDGELHRAEVVLRRRRQ